MENEPESIPPQSHRKQWRTWGYGLLALVVLMGAAFAAGRVLQLQGAAEDASGGNMVQMVSGGPGGGQMIELKGPKIIPATGLPTGEPDASGLYQRREDQSIFIGTGEIELRVMIPEEGADPITNAHANGPTVEVVVNRNTEIYKDITAISFEARRDGLEVQQVVEPLDSLDNLLEGVSKTDTLAVWGEQSGDRIIARVIVYRPFELPAEPPP